MLLLTVLLVATIAAEQLPGKPYYDLNDADNLFQQFLQKYGKVYNPEEYLKRLDIFKENLKEINERNAIHLQTEYGVTRFTDLTSEERNQRGLRNIEGFIEDLATKLVYTSEEVTAPDQFDWRDHGVVTHVKDQGDCGSCWVFSATGVIEGQYAIKHKQCVALSEQHSVDCIPSYATWDNCNGGYPHEVFKYFEQHDLWPSWGVASEEDYPYTGHADRCRESKVHGVVAVNLARVNYMDEKSLKQFLYDTGPLSIAMNFYEFTDYKKGIAFPVRCTPKSIMNHALLLVGYGAENGTDYWIIKNSAGAEWGEEGYIRLVRGLSACGIGRYVASCTVREPRVL